MNLPRSLGRSKFIPLRLSRDMGYPLPRLLLGALSLMLTSRLVHSQRYMVLQQPWSASFAAGIIAKSGEKKSDVWVRTGAVPWRSDGMTRNRSIKKLKTTFGQLRMFKEVETSMRKKLGESLPCHARDPTETRPVSTDEMSNSSEHRR